MKIFAQFSFQKNQILDGAESEKESARLKSMLGHLLKSCQRICFEKDLKKAYRDEYGQNINIVLEKLDTNLLNFLRFHCREFCSIFRPTNKHDHDYRIHPIVAYTSKIEETTSNRKKKHKKNEAPKLK